METTNWIKLKNDRRINVCFNINNISKIKRATDNNGKSYTLIYFIDGTNEGLVGYTPQEFCKKAGIELIDING